MQQTDKYKLNKPGIDDPLAIAPLNENMDKVDAALATKTDAAETAALDARVQMLELHKFVATTYIGNGEKTNDAQFIDLGFTPVLVVLNATAHTYIVSKDYSYSVAQIVPGGFKVFKLPNPYGTADANAKGVKYTFFAIC